MFANLDQHQSARDLQSRGELDDRVLWQRLKGGNDLAFSVLYKKYVQRLYNYGMHTCHDRDLVMDCIQELFSKLWERRIELADVEAVNFYLFKSFRRLLIARLVEVRRRSCDLPDENNIGFEILSSIEDSIILNESSVEEAARVKQAIAQLSKRQREMIFLKFYNDLSYQNVAAIMEMSVDSAYNLMSKAIDSLKKSLKKAAFILPAILGLMLN
jgi:RNA polymerase sigma factor (sigma-70 family)